ncbi:MAG: hypothetical protein JST26_04920 [Bacteroidetes bacterium]|nr:hypothetical protein [Bacteroidota bacterium]
MRVSKKMLLCTSLILSAIFPSCEKNRMDVLQDNIKQFVQSNFDDPASFELVEISKNIEDNIDYAPIMEADAKLLSDSLTAYLEASLAGNNKIPKDKLKEFKERREAIQQMQPSKNGYMIFAKFRAKNKLGALVLESGYFYTDTNMVVKNFKARK